MEKRKHPEPREHTLCFDARCHAPCISENARLARMHLHPLFPEAFCRAKRGARRHSQLRSQSSVFFKDFPRAGDGDPQSQPACEEFFSKHTRQRISTRLATRPPGFHSAALLPLPAWPIARRIATGGGHDPPRPFAKRCKKRSAPPVGDHPLRQASSFMEFSALNFSAIPHSV